MARDRKAFRLVFTLGLLALPACRKKDDAVIDQEFNEAFERQELGSGWRTTGGDFRLDHGELRAQRLDHHPIWLQRRLPSNVAVEFDARPTTDQGDIRVVLFGDGKSASPAGDGCGSSGYQLVFGGWKNRLSVICRGDQADGGHAQARSDWPVIQGRTYHHYITRKGGILEWFIDGHDMMAFKDPAPLQGPGHEFFGFDGGNSEVAFDNLVIAPVNEK